MFDKVPDTPLTNLLRVNKKQRPINGFRCFPSALWSGHTWAVCFNPSLPTSTIYKIQCKSIIFSWQFAMSQKMSRGSLHSPHIIFYAFQITVKKIAPNLSIAGKNVRGNLPLSVSFPNPSLRKHQKIRYFVVFRGHRMGEAFITFLEQ